MTSPRLGTTRDLNPYVGPRSFQRGDNLYGRDRETADLMDLLVAERIVTLHSPSGAGKTSLIQASLVPRLEADGFEVLSTVRVTHTPAGETIDAADIRNRYVMSTLMSLEEGLPTEAQRSFEELKALSLPEYLAQWPDPDGRPGNEVLIFDQFEEIFTTDFTDLDAKREYFHEIGVALRDRQLWALFSLREDFLAELDPYSRLVPTRFANRYRLDLLNVEQAIDAMVAPARDSGVDFTDEAATRLVDDLRRVRVQRANGLAEELGQYIEPVQLEVVCRQVWDNLDDGARIIDVSDVEAVGDVDLALAGYYAACVAETVASTGVREHRLREWFEADLITPQGFRGQTLAADSQHGDLTDNVLRVLTATHVIRGESRRGAVWYELAHDRLIEPIQADNARWRRANLSPFEQRVAWWDEHGRPEELLMTGRDLIDAREWEGTAPEEMSAREVDFLKASDRAQMELDKDARARVRTRRWLVVAVVGCIGALVASGFFYAAKQDANRQRSNAESAANQARRRAIVAEGISQVQSDTQLSLALGENALALGGTDEGTLDPVARTLFQKTLEVTPPMQALPGWDGPATAGTFSADGSLSAVSDTNGVIHVLNAQGRQISSLSSDGQVAALEFGAAPGSDMMRLAAGLDDGEVLVWTIGSKEQSTGSGSELDDVPVSMAEHTAPVTGIAFSHSGRVVASTGYDAATGVGGVVLTGVRKGNLIDEVTGTFTDVDWRRGRFVAVDSSGRLYPNLMGEPTRTIDAHEAAATAIAASPDGSLIATGGDDFTVKVWQADTGDLVSKVSTFGEVVDVQFTQDGTRVVAIDKGSAVTVIRATDGEDLGPAWITKGLTLTDLSLDPDNPARALVTTAEGLPAFWNIATAHPAYSRLSVEVADDGTPVTVASDGTVAVWSPTGYVSDQFKVPTGVQAAALSPDGAFIATVDTAGVATVTPLRHSATPLELSLGDAPLNAYSVDVSPDGEYIATGGSDGVVRVWDVATGRTVASRDNHTSIVTAVNFGRDAGQLASAASDGTAILWDTGLGTSSKSSAMRPVVGPQRLAATFPSSIDWSAEGSRVAIASFDASGSENYVELWDAQTGAAVAEPFTDNTDVVGQVTFDGAGDLLATVSQDKSIVVYDAESGERVQRIQRTDPGAGVAFSDFEGSGLFESGYRGSPYYIPLDDAELIEQAQARTLRELTCDDWSRVIVDIECPLGKG